MTISIRRTSRAADSPGRYFDRVSLDPYYMHRHRTGRSTSTWVPAGPLLQHLATPGNHLRRVKLPEQQTRRDPVQLLERQTTGAWQSFSPSRPSPSWVPAGPLLQHLSTLSYRPVDLPERRLRTPGHHFLRSIRSAGLEPNGPCRRSATAPSISTTSIHRTSSTSAIFS